MRKFLFLSFWMFSFCVYANPYDYKVLRVIDGDTVEIEAPFLPIELDQKLLVRIIGVDTPEHGFRAKCMKEYDKAEEAKKFVEEQIKNAKVVKVLFIKWDKYGGRIDGDIILDEERLSYKLLEQGYGVEYDGGKKEKDWCK